MGLIDSGSKSSRLLASRRYTHNTYTTAQESFTNVLDLRAEEIYTRAHLIPSSSLPYSGSSQKNLTFTKENQSVAKYWYRHQLTKSNVNNEVWFFLNPSGSSSGVGAQLINDNQQTDFISPKYGTSALANATTEDTTPGYLAVLYKSSDVASSEETSSLSSGDIVSTNDYQFDYKTGVVQFMNASADPSDSEYCYMTVYQYVGDTLKSGLDIDGQVSASSMLVTGTLKAGNISSTETTLATASIAAITASISRLDTESSLATASIAAITSSVSRINDDITLATASIAAITSSLSTISGTGELQGLGTTSSPLFNSVTASADVSASGNIYGTGNLDIDGTSNFAGDVTIDSDLDVTGTITAVEVHTTYVSSSIAVSSGSNTFGDATDDHHSFTGSLSVSSSLSVTGSTTVDGTLTATNIGAFTAAGAIDFDDQNMTNVDIDSGDITGVTFGTATSTIITGSSTALSSSIATRFDARESDMTLATASIASNETNMTLATASIAAITASVSTINDNMTLATASIAAITASVSRIDTEIDTNTTNITLATASIAAITASVSRIDTEIDTNTTNITLATASIAAITASLGIISGTGELQGLGTTSSPTFNSITSSGEISASGRVFVNNSFPQLKLSDDGYTDHAKIGLLGDSIYLQGSDTSIGVRLRRSDNFDIARFIMSSETTEISGSGGLDVKTHITASGNISASGNIYGANITASSGISSTDLYIDDYIYHNDDTDTYIGYPTGDKIDFVAGGINFVRAWQKDDDTDKLWFNPNEEPMNFRFYTNENSPGLRISGSGHVGMFGISKPSASVHMGGNLWVESHITASGNISASGTIYADNFQSTGGDSEGISFTDDLNITGNITASGHISGSSTSTGSFGRIEAAGNINTIGGRVYEQGTSVVDHATAMAIVFGG
jgi:cytoskeletal protein CcmA (bactofilin family)